MNASIHPTEALIVLASGDNVAIAKRDVAVGESLTVGGDVIVADRVPAMHKMALATIRAGSAIVKYDQIIGVACIDIHPGEHVHVHNCKIPENGNHASTHAQFSQVVKQAPLPPISQFTGRRFLGYHRKSGRIGTRNYIGIIPTVNCAVTVAHGIARALAERVKTQYAGAVDGIHVLSHEGGCGGSKSGSDGFENLRRVLSGYASHPNYGGILMIGLGCEVMQIKELEPYIGSSSERFRSLVIQESGGTDSTVATGIRVVEELLELARSDARAETALGNIKLALKCGGSDAFSGITANPALGCAVDMLVALGGTAILSETTEVYGAEGILMSRATDPGIRRDLKARLEWWKRYAEFFGASLDNNPSPGNKAGGLTTILEKSLGAVAKGGHSPLNGVYRYGAPIDRTGLVFMDSPGYDPVTVTGQIASGANVVCFTTGRGSAFGSKPVPTIKLSSNSALFERQKTDIDVNCGAIADADASPADVGAEILDEVIEVASGKRTKSELHGYGDHEFVPWHIGAVL